MKPTLSKALVALLMLAAAGAACVAEKDYTDDTLPIRETGYLNCTENQEACGDALQCETPDGGLDCVEFPSCAELECACVADLVCGNRPCSEENGRVVCGASEGDSPGETEDPDPLPEEDPVSEDPSPSPEDPGSEDPENPASEDPETPTDPDLPGGRTRSIGLEIGECNEGPDGMEAVYFSSTLKASTVYHDLHVIHKNVTANCCAVPAVANVEFMPEDAAHTARVTYGTEGDGSCNCLCQFDLSYTIPNVYVNRWTFQFGSLYAAAALYEISPLEDEEKGCIAAYPNSIDFGSVEIGQSKQEEILFVNCGDTALYNGVEMHGLSDLSLEYDLQNDLPLTWLPGESRTATLTWTPDAVTDLDAVLRARHMGGTEPRFAFPVSGQGVDAE